MSMERLFVVLKLTTPSTATAQAFWQVREKAFVAFVGLVMVTVPGLAGQSRPRLTRVALPRVTMSLVPGDS